MKYKKFYQVSVELDALAFTENGFHGFLSIMPSYCMLFNFHLFHSAHNSYSLIDFAVFGDSGLYLIVKGSCLPNESQKIIESPIVSRMESILSLDYTTESQTFRKVSTVCESYFISYAHYYIYD